MSLFEWIGLGALMFALLFFSARVMKRGLTTLDADRARFGERIAADHKRIDQDRKDISAHEQIYMMRAALEDLMRLEGEEMPVEERGNILTLTSAGYEIELVMRERLLASTRTVIHGSGRWILRGNGLHEEYYDAAALMASLSSRLHGYALAAPEPDHIARRISAGIKAHKRYDGG